MYSQHLLYTPLYPITTRMPFCQEQEDGSSSLYLLSGYLLVWMKLPLHRFLTFRLQRVEGLAGKSRLSAQLTNIPVCPLMHNHAACQTHALSGCGTMTWMHWLLLAW